MKFLTFTFKSVFPKVSLKEKYFFKTDLKKQIFKISLKVVNKKFRNTTNLIFNYLFKHWNLLNSHLRENSLNGNYHYKRSYQEWYHLHICNNGEMTLFYNINHIYAF